MDNDVVIFWVVFFIALSGVAVGLARIRSVGAGWVMVNFAILLLDGIGKLGQQRACIYLAAALWVILVLVPGSDREIILPPVLSTAHTRRPGDWHGF